MDRRKNQQTTDFTDTTDEQGLPLHCPFCFIGSAMSSDGQQVDLLPCPMCGQPTDSLKHYRYVRWCAFLLAGAVYQAAEVQACPTCMRAFLRRSLLINVVPANLLWPIFILPWGLILVATSYRKGHSRRALETVALNTGPARAELPPGFCEQVSIGSDPEEVSWPRITAILAVLLCWIPILGLLFGGLAWLLNRRQAGWQRVCSLVGLSISVLVTLALVALLATVG
jgi:hypothetical protein